MLIRAATSVDIVHLYELWYDNMALQQQHSHHIQIVPNARDLWTTYADSLIRDDDVTFLVCDVEGAIPGYIVASRTENMPGLTPSHYALVHMLILDLHMTSAEKGVGKALLAALIARLQEQSLKQIRVSVGVGMMVEDAFWRGMSAKKSHDVFWVDL